MVLSLNVDFKGVIMITTHTKTGMVKDKVYTHTFHNSKKRFHTTEQLCEKQTSKTGLKMKSPDLEPATAPLTLFFKCPLKISIS